MVRGERCGPKKLRAEKTDQLIQTSFIELLKKKGSSGKVSVAEICREAKNNRGTFYLHYETVDQLIDCLELEYAQKFIEAVSVYHFDKNTTEFFDSVFRAVKENQELFYFHFFLSNGKGQHVFETFLQERMLPIWLQNSTLNEEEGKLVMKFLLTGTMSYLKEWYRSGFQDEERLKRVFDSLVKHGLYSLVYLKE